MKKDEGEKNRRKKSGRQFSLLQGKKKKKGRLHPQACAIGNSKPGLAKRKGEKARASVRHCLLATVVEGEKAGSAPSVIFACR